MAFPDFCIKSCTNDKHLVLIARIYLRVLAVSQSSYSERVHNDLLCPLLNDLLKLAENIKPQTLEGCAAKLVLACVDADEKLKSLAIMDRMEGETILEAKNIILNL